MVLLKGKPAVRKCIVILISSTTTLLYTHRLITNTSGELIADWTAEPHTTGELIVEATDCHRAQPTAVRHTVKKASRNPDGRPLLHSSQYRYHLGSNIRLHITGSSLLRHKLVIQKCGDGKLISVIIPQNNSLELTAGRDMYPCIHLSSLSLRGSAADSRPTTSTLTLFIDPSSRYEMLTDRLEYSSSDDVSLYLLPNDFSMHRAVLFAKTSNRPTASSNPIKMLRADFHPRIELIESRQRLSSFSSHAIICDSTLHYDPPRNLSADDEAIYGNIARLLEELTTQSTAASRSSLSTNPSHTEQSQQSMISTTIQPTYTQSNNIISRSQSTLPATTIPLPTETSSSTGRVTTLPRMNWLPSNSRYRNLGLPEHWFSLSEDIGSASDRRKRNAPHNCHTQLEIDHPNEIARCSDGTYKFKLPAYDPSDWLLNGLVVSPEFGLQVLQPLRVHRKMETYLTIKSPPSDLSEGEQFQIHISVITSRPPEPVNAHVKLLLSSEEAFCFKNLILNTYPHVNLTIGTASTVTATSFTATALRRGNFTVSIELWIEEERIHVISVPLEVSALQLLDDKYDSKNSSSVDESSTEVAPSPADSTNLQLKMRYSKEDNQQRCKGFRLKVDHSVLPPPTSSPTGSTGLFGEEILSGRRRRAISPHVISSIPKHSLRICYRILQKTSSGSYYIDVESFTGYKPSFRQEESGDENCKIENEDVDTYDKGNIIMIKKSVGNHSWCCFSLVLESAELDSRAFTVQPNQSASVRMHDINSPGDFCLEFYNLHSRSPYSDHICSQHGCLCTEESISTCKQIRTHSTRKATLVLAKIYAAARYAFKVTVASQSELNQDGFLTQELVVVESYGNTHLETGQRLLIYYKRRRRNCQLFNTNSSYIIMGRQLHIQHEDLVTSSLYLDDHSSVVNIDELKRRLDYASIQCFLDSLLCPTSPASTSPSTSTIHYLGSPQALASQINSNCRMRSALKADGTLDLYTVRLSNPDNQCKSDMSHLHKLRRIYKSIRRRHTRPRRHRS